MSLSNLRPPRGAKHKKKRVGRGPGSGHGKTAARGHKGAQSRSGYKTKRGFEGGQMPLHRRLPKRGFTNIFAKSYNVVSLGRVQQAIEAGKLDAGQPVTVEALKAAGVVKRVRDGVRLLSDGELKTAVTFQIAGASKAAVAAVEKAGGTVEILEARTTAEA